MTIESGIENAGVYIDTLDDTYPAGGDDLVEGDNHIRGIKNCILNTFPAITGAVTSTHTELNILDGVTSTTAELNILDGVTATAAELNYVDVATPGTAEASKALVVDGSRNIGNLATVTATAFSGNASTATALATGRTISLTGQATGTSGSFDGTGNVSITASLNESITASGTWSITATSTQVLPAGIVNFVLTAGGGTLYLELYVSGSWRRTNAAIYSGTVFSDGTNMRLYSTPSTATVYYQVW